MLDEEKKTKKTIIIDTTDPKSSGINDLLQVTI